MPSPALDDVGILSQPGEAGGKLPVDTTASRNMRLVKRVILETPSALACGAEYPVCLGET